MIAAYADNVEVIRYRMENGAGECIRLYIAQDEDLCSKKKVKRETYYLWFD
jgi:hypothetical protein